MVERNAVMLTSREWMMICERLCIDYETADVDLIDMKIGALVDALRIVRQERDDLQWFVTRQRAERK